MSTFPRGSGSGGRNRTPNYMKIRTKEKKRKAIMKEERNAIPLIKSKKQSEKRKNLSMYRAERRRSNQERQKRRRLGHGFLFPTVGTKDLWEMSIMCQTGGYSCPATVSREMCQRQRPKPVKYLVDFETCPCPAFMLHCLRRSRPKCAD